MPSYAATLGHQPHISIAELAAVIPDFSITRKVDKKLVLFETTQKLDAEFLKHLGGTVILAERLSGDVLTVSDVPQLLLNEVKKVKGKVIFGLRTVGIPAAQVRDLYRSCKKKMKDRGRSSRYVGSEQRPALSVVLHDSGLLDGSHGCELTIILEEEDETWIGRTIAAQDIDAYTHRDVEKPVRDTTIGLLPPKLAQILLNFGEWLVEDSGSQKPKPKKGKRKLTIFDPFCGTGVIPMECLLNGWPVLASDKSQKAVNGCTKNLEWLRKEKKILKKDIPSTIWKQDALKPFELKEQPDVIVTESTLGPTLNKRPPVKDATKMRSENEKIQAGFLKNAAETLPGVPIVCTWPVWYNAKKQISLEKIWSVVEEAGYEPVLPPEIEPSVQGRVSLIYRRPDQFVGREIVMLRPKV